MNRLDLQLRYFSTDCGTNMLITWSWIEKIEVERVWSRDCF